MGSSPIVRTTLIFHTNIYALEAENCMEIGGKGLPARQRLQWLIPRIL